MVETAIDSILGKKGGDLAIFDMRDFTPYVDYQMIVSATSAIHAKVLLKSVKESLSKIGVKARSIEGTPESGWILLDFWDIIVHVFNPDLRKYYNLEGLWGDLPSLKLTNEEAAIAGNEPEDS